jgi:hypothetical protein
MLNYMKDMPEKQNIGAGFTEGELQFASFWVRNQAIVRKAVYAVLIGVNVIFWGYSLWGFIDAYALSYPRESRITEDIEANGILLRQLSSNQPKSVETRSVSVFQSTDNRLDMIVPIHNSNEQWYAKFTYRFNVSGELTPVQSGFILPGQSSYLGAFGFAPEKAGARTASLTVDNIRWMRLDPSLVGADYDAWIARRDAFEISNVTYDANLRVGSNSISRTSFTFRNPTAYGYWEVGVYIILKRGDAPAASNFIKLTNVRPGETRQINADWFEELPTISDTEIVPVVNFLDDSAYLPSSRF